ncbi:MAG: AMP-binding protein [Balneolales bacterium]
MNQPNLSFNSQSIFLESNSGTYTYKDVEDYTKSMTNWLAQNWPYFHKPKIALEANSSDELFLTMAACWILELPIIPLDVAFISRSKIERVDPEIFFGRSHSALSKFDSLHIPALTFDSIKACSLELEVETRKLNSDGLFAYLFTSGSSGRAKLVPCKKDQMVHAAMHSAGLIKPGPKGLWLHCLPLSHMGGVSIIPRSLEYNTGIYRADGFNAETIADLITNNPRIEIVSLVPTMLKRLLDVENFKPNPNLKALFLGGGPISQNLLEIAHDKGLPIVTSYGMTETCGMIAAQKYKPENAESTGFTLEGNEIKIQDDKGQTAQTGASGLILVKGPQVFDGYTDEENNRESFDEEGWFRTGDFGSMDSKGCLTVEARRTDLIISGGENVSPYEIETMINALPGVLESAVTGVPDEEWGQKIVALITFEMAELEDIDQVTTSLKQMLPPYKIPKSILSVKSLPKTSLGKLQREEIRKMVLEL